MNLADAPAKITAELETSRCDKDAGENKKICICLCFKRDSFVWRDVSSASSSLRTGRRQNEDDTQSWYFRGDSSSGWGSFRPLHLYVSDLTSRLRGKGVL